MPDLGQLPLSLRARSRWTTLAGVPALIVHPDPVEAIHADEAGARPRDATNGRRSHPALVWMHGRTASKEIDPGRFLRLVRAGIGVVSLDLPGHGERADPRLIEASATLDVVEQMERELDAVVSAAMREGPFDPQALAIGGFSAGGMVTLMRLCRPHSFRAAIVEATTGDWQFLHHRRELDEARIARVNPIRHLEAWVPTPLLVLHAENDEWVPIESQRAFVAALHARGVPSELIEFRAFPRTGAPFEHIGFGRYASEAKDLGAEFLGRHLLGGAEPRG